MVGTNAARVAAGMGADVTVLDKSLSRLRYIDDVFGHLFKNGYASQKSTAELASQADLNQLVPFWLQVQRLQN